MYRINHKIYKVYWILSIDIGGQSPFKTTHSVPSTVSTLHPQSTVYYIHCQITAHLPLVHSPQPYNWQLTPEHLDVPQLSARGGKTELITAQVRLISDTALSGPTSTHQWCQIRVQQVNLPLSLHMHYTNIMKPNNYGTQKVAQTIQRWSAPASPDGNHKF